MSLIAVTFPLLFLLGVALVLDLRERRIPNWLTGLIFITGLTNAAWYGSPVSLGQAGLGVLVGIAIFLVPFALGMVGGGDFKMLVGIGAWLGPIATLQSYAAGALVGMIIVLVQCSLNGRLTELLRNSTLMVATVVTADREGLQRAVASSVSMRSVENRWPWAVSAVAGVVVTVLMNVL